MDLRINVNYDEYDELWLFVPLVVSEATARKAVNRETAIATVKAVLASTYPSRLRGRFILCKCDQVIEFICSCG